MASTTGGKEVKGIANGTTNDAAVNKGQMDAAVQNALAGTKRWVTIPSPLVAIMALQTLKN